MSIITTDLRKFTGHIYFLHVMFLQKQKVMITKFDYIEFSIAISIPQLNN